MLQRPKRETRPPYGERLIILKSGLSTPLPYPFSVESQGDVKFRITEDARAYNHGGAVSGDGKADSRKIKIGVHLKGLSEEQHDKAMNYVYGLFAQRDYDLVIGRPDRVYHVAGLTEAKQKYLKGFKQRWSDVDFTLLLSDPFRYAAEESKKEFVLADAALDAPLTINNAGNIDTPLKITLQPAVSMAEVTLEHVESGRASLIRDSLLTSPATLLLDTKQGTVRRGTYNAINAFSGQFLYALPGVNTYKITAAAGKVTIAYTERWLI